MKLLISAGSVLLGAMLFQLPTTPPMRMGLWQTTSKTKITGINLPPGQSLPGLAGQTATMQSCLTPESYRKNIMAGQRPKDCVISHEKMTDRHFAFDISCSSGKSTGHLEMDFLSKETSHGTMHMQIDSGAGKPIVIDSVSDGKFVSADCGRVTPDKPVMGR